MGSYSSSQNLETAIQVARTADWRYLVGASRLLVGVGLVLSPKDVVLHLTPLQERWQKGSRLPICT